MRKECLFFMDRCGLLHCDDECRVEEILATGCMNLSELEDPNL